MNFPIVFPTLATEIKSEGMKLGQLEDGSLKMTDSLLSAEVAPSFSLALQRVLGEATLAETETEEIPELAVMLDEAVLHLLQAEEWTEEDWQSALHVMSSLLPNELPVEQQRPIISMLEQSPSFARLAVKLSDQQRGLMELLQASIEVDEPNHEPKRIQQLNQNVLFEEAVRSLQATQVNVQAKQPVDSNVQQLMAAFHEVVTDTVKQLQKSVSAEQLEGLKSSNNLFGQLVKLAEQVPQMERNLFLQAVVQSIEIRQEPVMRQSIDVVRQQTAETAEKSELPQVPAESRPVVMREGVPLQSLDHKVSAEPQTIVSQPTTGQAEPNQFSLLGQMKDVVPQPTVHGAAAKPATVLAHVNMLHNTVTDLLVQKWQTTQLNGVSEAKIKLFPEQLGHLDITIRLHNGQMVAQFVAESMAGKEMLESQLLQLRHSLQNQGIQVSKIEVLHQTEQQQMFDQHERHAQSEQQWTTKQHNKGTGYEMDYEEWYDDLERSITGDVNPLLHGGVFEASV